MNGFSRASNGQARIGQCLIGPIASRHDVETPAYLYDMDGIADGARALVEALGSSAMVAYAVKANSAGSILRALHRQGVGADVVSAAELKLALDVGIAPQQVVMSGVAKTNAEIDLALSYSIRALQLESVEEIARVEARAAALGRNAAVALRINPGVAIDSHAHVATGHEKAKFGVPLSSLSEAFAALATCSRLSLVGVSTHVGSTLTDPAPYLSAARVVCRIARERRATGSPLAYINFGGGFGIDYGKVAPAAPVEFAQAARLLRREEHLEDHQLIIEPGRSLVGPYGVLLARVTQSKQTQGGRWLLLDTGMNDLLRPALYHAHHRIEALDAAPHGAPWQVVGPVCESADDFGAHVIAEQAPSHVVIRDAGAYGYTMASNYNGRALPTEVFTSGGQVEHIARAADSDAWVRNRLLA